MLPHPFDPALAVVQLTKGYQAVISAIDADAVGRFTWSASAKPGCTTYAVRMSGKRTVKLHRFIADISGMCVSGEIDHRDGNGLNCQRSNLRAATHQQNSANVTARRSSRSGIRGVEWIPDKGKWRARMMVHGKAVYLGYFATSGDAERVAIEARARAFGEFGNRKEAEA